MTAAPPFTTARLAMRALRVDDAAALHEAYGDPVAMRYWSSPPHRDVAETIDYIAPRPGHDPWCDWAITRRGDDRAIGTLAAGERRPCVVEIGYLLVPSAWGQGLAHEAVSALVARLFQGGARRLFADTDPDNVASNTLLERLGFVREGLLRAEWETHIGVRDSVVWGLLRGEWSG